MIIQGQRYSGLKRAALRSRNWGFRGLGQPTDYASYVAACEGTNPNCQPMDQACITSWQNIVNACDTQYVTDPNSPHNSVTPTTDPTPIVNNPTLFAQMTTVASTPGPVAVIPNLLAPPATTPNTGTGPHRIPPRGPGGLISTGTVTSGSRPGTGTGPLPPRPASPGPVVVNPSPGTQSTNATTTAYSYGSAQSQANGTTAGTTGVTSTVQGYISDLTSGTDIIPGIPNLLLFAGGVLAIAFIAEQARKGF